jgi:hypothetical protein
MTSTAKPVMIKVFGFMGEPPDLSMMRLAASVLPLLTP